MKKYLGIFVVLLAVVASAFTVNPKNTKRAGNSYTYNLYGQWNQDDPVEIGTAANYSYAGTGSLGCTLSGHTCGVEDATDDGFGHPDFTQFYTPKVRN